MRRAEYVPDFATDSEINSNGFEVPGYVCTHVLYV